MRGPSPRAIRARAAPSKRPRGAPSVDHEGAARLLDAHDDYRVLRRLKPRPVVLATHGTVPDQWEEFKVAA